MTPREIVTPMDPGSSRGWVRFSDSLKTLDSGLRRNDRQRHSWTSQEIVDGEDVPSRFAPSSREARPAREPGGPTEKGRAGKRSRGGAPISRDLVLGEALAPESLCEGGKGAPRGRILWKTECRRPEARGIAAALPATLPRRDGSPRVGPPTGRPRPRGFLARPSPGPHAPHEGAAPPPD